MPAEGREYSLEDFARRLGVTADQVARIDFRPALQVCSYLIQNDTRERFRRGEDPDGHQWKPLKRPRRGGAAATPPPKPKKARKTKKARKGRKHTPWLTRKLKAKIAHYLKKMFGPLHKRPGGGKRKPARKKGRSRANRKAFVPGVDLPLWDTGRLVASVGANSADHVETAGRTELVYGTNVSYAPYHQFGTRTIPARPFLGIGKDLGDQIENVLVQHVVDEIVKALGG